MIPKELRSSVASLKALARKLSDNPTTQHVMQLMANELNRIFKFMNSPFVPVIESYSARQKGRMLKRAGFASLINLSYFHGVNELLLDCGYCAELRWGSGVLRYLVQKPERR